MLGIIELIIQWAGGLLAYSTLGIILYGIWHGTQRQEGLKTGLSGSWLHSPWFYLASSALFFGICYFAWILLPIMVSQPNRIWMLAVGSLLYFPGMCLVLWGRLTLGKNYFVSTGFGAQLFADHNLVTSGPYAIIRHPMYFGLFLAALGSVLIYLTWTTLLFVIFTPLTIVRAHREETALAIEFGEQWKEYSRCVPAFIPRLLR